MWILLLNDMRASNIENVRPVARAHERSVLEQYLARETVESYRDGQWAKSFRKGGPLEWYNPPFFHDESFVYVGTEDDWAANARQDYRNKVLSIPNVPV